MSWKVVKVERVQVTREDVVELFGEESVAKYERDLLLGVDRPLEVKNTKRVFLGRVFGFIRSLFNKGGV